MHQISYTASLLHCITASSFPAKHKMTPHEILVGNRTPWLQISIQASRYRTYIGSTVRQDALRGPKPKPRSPQCLHRCSLRLLGGGASSSGGGLHSLNLANGELLHGTPPLFHVPFIWGVLVLPRGNSQVKGFRRINSCPMISMQVYDFVAKMSDSSAAPAEAEDDPASLEQYPESGTRKPGSTEPAQRGRGGRHDVGREQKRGLRP